ncbi:YetF domain-containing protein [Selenihalanaerobacter shriftii]|uniref:Uncharacterized membrane protein YcaP, DUF421 family n=1 Tax=Selenihalanaerobacter shriftii TaxID=142842 RepID=A0A1T4PTJ3_9FIRM|nr:DUF421 domain-containing protein [Selenihalanaerobacter shriftii]SJZ94875.1 Uncharacterized membrane protein YcaP, DUF421 family [Selenihalanaerobacter shriftii]
MNETLVVIVRGLIALLTLLIFTRILGKQQISQLTYFDYILGITIGSTASTLTTDTTIRAWPHWVGLVVWVLAVMTLQVITLKSRKASKYVDGEPTIVIMNGKIMEDTMRKMRYRITDLLEQLRNKGVFNLSQVEFAILETNGKLSVLKKSQYQSVTPKDMNISTNYKGLSIELIYDGIILEQNLEQVNLDKTWLTSQLNQLGINDISSVILASLDTQGKLYVDTSNDNIEIPIDTSDYLGPN